MVKPIPAQRLPRQSTVSLHEEELSSNNEMTLQYQPTESAEGEHGPTERNSRLEASGDETEVLSTLSPMAESASGGAGDYADTPGSPSTSGSNVKSRTVREEEGDRVPDPGHNHFASSYACPRGVSPQTAALSQDLYLRFLHEEIRVTSVRGPPCLDPWREATLDRRYYDTLNASVRVRRSLRQVADVFATSELRELVREKAASVDIESLDFNSFQDLLFGLFQEGGLTSERVVVLFFFCADLIIRSLHEQLTSGFHHLLDWSQLYIAGTFSVWVEQHGGWAAVLDESANCLYTAAKIGLVCASIVALCIYIRNAR